jgi:hypothetical protein
MRSERGTESIEAADLTLSPCLVDPSQAAWSAPPEGRA